jgi:hypothetical protein
VGAAMDTRRLKSLSGSWYVIITLAAVLLALWLRG